MPVITVNNIVKKYRVRKKTGWKGVFKPSYSEVLAVKGISFQVEKGESVAFLGPNGAGKTTTIKMLSGLIYPTSGEAKVLGFTPFERKKQFLQRIGLVMGNKSSLDWDLTPRQSFSLLQKIYRTDRQKHSTKVKKFTELLETEKLLDTQVRKLSLGERLKMEVIGAILHEPEVLFLDEPTIGLDVIAKQNIRRFFRDIQKETQTTLLLTSHDMDDVEKVCDRVIVINHGEKIYDDNLGELTSMYNKDKFIKAIFKKKPGIEKLAKYGEVINEDETSVTLKVPSTLLPEILAKLATKYKLYDIDILSTPLEEIISDLFHVSG